jgi:hypothetical protein
LVLYLPGIYDARIAQGSPGDGQRRDPHHVVHDLMAAKNVYGIGFNLTTYVQPYDLLPVSHPLDGLDSGNVIGVCDGTDAIPA